MSDCSPLPLDHKPWRSRIRYPVALVFFLKIDVMSYERSVLVFKSFLLKSSYVEKECVGLMTITKDLEITSYEDLDRVSRWTRLTFPCGASAFHLITQRHALAAGCLNPVLRVPFPFLRDSKGNQSPHPVASVKLTRQRS